MLQVNQHDNVRPKCFFQSSTLPSYLDQKQFPTKKNPFPAIASQQCYHTLDMVMPASNAETLQQHCAKPEHKVQYARVYMKLSQLLEGDFFNRYIKIGNILMISEGRRLTDNVFTLAEGVLRLEVDKPTYERLGLQGKLVPSGGRKHVHARFEIALNLRLPSMLSGKKGFARIVWAFQNVLNDTVTWLFHDLDGPNDGSGPLAPHLPLIREIEPQISRQRNVLVPAFPESVGLQDHETFAELLEWTSLVLQGSPRIDAQDQVDSHLSRYQVEGTGQYSAAMEASLREQSVIKMQWHGLMPSVFIRNVFLRANKVSEASWFVMSATGFDGKACTILQNGSRTFTWEYMD